MMMLVSRRARVLQGHGAKEMSMKIAHALASILSAGLMGVSGREVAQANGSQFTTIDDPNGMNGTFAYAINARGDIVGQYLDNADMVHGFLLSRGRYITIDDPSGVNG